MSSLSLRAATPAEIHVLYAGLPEFAALHGERDIQARLAGRVSHLLIALCDGVPAGFKIGYALDDTVFYSWLGGVLPPFRRQGIAQFLLQAQQAWALNQGYHRIEVKTRNSFPAMLMMLIKNGYQLIELEKAESVADNRLRLAKVLTEPQVCPG